MMMKSPFRPVLLLVFMLFLTIGNVIRMYDKYPVRPIMAVWLVAMGMLFGAVIFAFVSAIREKNKRGE
jgi:hypothetical protein